MLNEHNTVFARSGLLYATGEPTRVVDANGISIASAVFAGPLGVRPTDHATYNRRSTQWRSQMLLLSMATTSIYWSS